TGLAQPKKNGLVPIASEVSSRKPGSSTVPTGSTCGSGFNVSRPARAAVGSPHAYATTPCATSWNTTATRSGTATIAIWASMALDSIRTQSIRHAPGRARKPRSCPRMVAAVHGAQPLRCDVGVYLRRADVGVAEKCLDDAQIGASAQEVGGERVPQGV